MTTTAVPLTTLSPFAVATRRQSATRTRMARLTVQARTWAALRGTR